MSSRIQCFWLDPLPRARVSLRRFVHSTPADDGGCSGPMGYHHAEVRIEDVELPLGSYECGEDDHPHDDPRWPTKCEGCGRPFVDADVWQRRVVRLYWGAPGGEPCTLRDAPPGAMYDADWWPQKGPDGICLHVCLPPNGGDDYWNVDGPASNGPGWSREGAPPNVTARPSIQTPRYHGFLTNGFLVEC